MRVVTGHQPVYLPWLGLFHKIALADVFVFMDDVQYLEGDWNNRNRVKGPHGPFWLTVPVRRGAGRQRLCDVTIADDGAWASRHWTALRTCYGRARYWPEHAAFLEDTYLARRWTSLADLNAHLLRYLLGALGIDVRWVTATEA
ncbi:MAG: WbqC family protein, partial [Planctomycetota bacterium]